MSAVAWANPNDGDGGATLESKVPIFDRVQPKKHYAKYRCLSFLTGIMISGGAWAHHSFAAYDMTRTNVVKATLAEFRWGAPHSSMVAMFAGPDGRPQRMAVVTASPLSFVKQGFKPKDFHVGDKVELSWHPNRSGALGGSLARLKLSDGRQFVETEGFGPPPGAAGPPPAAPGAPQQ